MPSPHRPLDIFPITTRTLQVLRVVNVTPGMRRVTLGGELLAAHVAANGYPVAAFRSEGFDDEFKLILRHPGSEVTVGPTQNDGVLDWPRGDEHLLYRTYTVRRWDATAGEVDVDLVLHGGGAAATWARQVKPGESVQIAGPKMSAPHPRGVDWVLVGGDETALPAIGRMLEEWPAGCRGQVFIEVERDSHRQDLPVPAGVELTWLSRRGAPAGTTSVLFDALRAAEWWEGDCFAWVAGEAGMLAPIRRWLRRDMGLDAANIEVAGYWRRRVLEDDSAQGENGGPVHGLGELTGLLPPFAVRVAATVGVGEALAAGPARTSELATALGVPAGGLAKLLRYLGTLGVLQHQDSRWSLTPRGGDLADDEETAYLDLDRVHARREIGAAMSLLDAIRSGSPASWFGRPWAEDVAADTAHTLDLARTHDEDAAYIAGGIAGAEPLVGLGRVAVAGPGAAVVARALVEAHGRVQVDLVASPSQLAAVAELHAAHERIHPQPGSLLGVRPAPVDAVLLLGVLLELPDEDAVHALRCAVDSLLPGGSVLLLEEVMEDDPDEHDAEDDLVAFGLTGGGMRTEAEVHALFRGAGLGEPTRTTIGWGYGLYSASRVGGTT